MCYIPPELLQKYDNTKVKKLDLEYQKQFVRVLDNKQSKLSSFSILNSKDVESNQKTDNTIYTKAYFEKNQTPDKISRSELLAENELDKAICKKSKLNDLTVCETSTKSGNLYSEV